MTRRKELGYEFTAVTSLQLGSEPLELTLESTLDIRHSPVAPIQLIVVANAPS